MARRASRDRSSGIPIAHHAADGRHPVHRPRRLSAAAGRAPAAGRLPDHPGVGLAAGRQPGDHGLVGGAAARAAVRADPGRRPADLDRARSARAASRSSSISTATSTPPPTTCRSAINAAGGQLPKNLPSPPTYRKVNPADAPIMLLSRDLRHAAADRGRRQRRHQDRAADQPDLGRLAGLDRRRAEARRSASRSTRRSSSPRACRSRTCARAIGVTTVDSPKGNIDGRGRATRSTPTTS